MSDSLGESLPEPGIPTVIRPRRWPSLVWLVPAVAALIGLSMLVHAWLSAGPTIGITFQTATGLDAGKTPVKYKDVVVGTVTAINLSRDGSHVVVTVSLDKSAESLAHADSRFWVVRPRIGLGGVSGIDTLLSGAYIGVDKGTSSQPARSFTGLETPPTVIHGTPGRSFTLRADDLGSLDIGSPVYYRRIQVGRVASYQLDRDGQHLDLQVFIDAPYDRFVTPATRFWNASGIDVSLGADGLKLNTQSLATVVAGGIAFTTPPPRDGTASNDTHGSTRAVYELAKDEQAALATPDGPAEYFQLRFEHSLRGLATGAPVEFFGLNVGQVVSIRLDYDPAKKQFLTVVGIVVYPNRLGGVTTRLREEEGDSERQIAQFLAGMVAHGLRAQARSGNLLTGQLYISLDFLPKAPPATFDMHARPFVLPTANGDFDRMQEQVASIISKIEKMPLDSIGRHLDASLADLDQTLRQVNSQVLPETTRTLQQAQRTFGAAQGMLDANAPLQQNLDQTLQQLQRAARSLREFLDLLGRHPEALLRGRPADPPSAAVPPTPESRP